MNEIQFLKSRIASKPAPPPDKHAVNHLLLPQWNNPTYKKNVEDSNFQQNSKQIHKSIYTNVKWANSRSTSKGLELSKSRQYISNSIQKASNSREKTYLTEFPPPKIEIRVIYQNSKDFRQKLSNSCERRQKTNLNSQEKLNEQHKEQRKKFKAEKYSHNNSQQQFQSDIPKDEKNVYHSNYFIRNEQISEKRQTFKSNQSNHIQKQLTDELAKTKVEIGELDLLNKHLQHQLHTCHEQIALKQSENIYLVGKNQELIKIYDFFKQFQAARQNAEEEGKQLRNKNNFLYSEIERHMNMLTLQKVKNQQISFLVQNLKTNIIQRQELFQNQLKKNDLNYKNLLFQNYQIKQREKNYIRQIDGLKNQIKNSEGEMKEMKAKRGQLQNLLYQKIQQINKLRTSLQSKEQEILNIKLKHQQQRYQIIQKNQNQLKQARITINSQIEQIELTNFKRKELQTNIILINKEKNQRINEIKNQLQQAKIKINSQKQQLQQAKLKIKELQRYIQLMKEDKNQRIIEIQNLKTQIKQLCIQKEGLKDEIKQLSFEIQKILTQLKQKNQTIVQLTNKIATYQSKISQLLKTIQLLKKQVQEKSNKIQALYADISNLQDINGQLKREIITKENTISSQDQTVKKYEKLKNIYKEQLSRANQNKQVQWQEMKNVYQNQISIMEAKLLSQSQSAKKSNIKQQYKILTTKTYTSNSTEKIVGQKYDNEYQ